MLFIRVLLFFFLAFALSCGHYQGPEYSSPEYSGPGEFSTPDELYQSEEVQKQRRHIQRGPFQLRWPVAKLTLSRGFSDSGRKAHYGLDIRGKKGSPIFAAHDGVIIYAGNGFRGFGKMIILEYDQTWATLYGHLNKFRIKTGQEVKAGDIIGEMGRTGRATGVHLHFELMRNKTPIDPTKLVPSNQSGTQSINLVR